MPRLINESGATSVAIFGAVRCSSEELTRFFTEIEVEQVEWWLEVDFAKQVELYSSSKALLFPSIHEGLGLPILEAYCCGTAVFVRDLAPMNQLTLPSGLLNMESQYPSSGIRESLSRNYDSQVYRKHVLGRFSSHTVCDWFDSLASPAKS